MSTQISPFNLDSNSRKYSFSVIMMVGLNLDVRIVSSAYYPFTIDKIVAHCGTGSINVTLSINGVTTVTGVDNVPIGTSGSVITPTANNSLVEEDALVLTFSNQTNATMVTLEFHCTEDYKQAE